MSKTVFILGAGASAESGAPVMKQFLDFAEEILIYSPSVLTDDEKKSFQNIFQALEVLQAVHYKATFDPRNIEDIFGAFEMAALIGKLGRLENEKVELLRRAVKTVILRTLEERIIFPVKNEKVFPPQPYNEFCNLLNKFPTPNQASIITFNYDLAVDYALFFNRFFVDYSVTTDKRTSTDVVRRVINVLKLHGSLNWANCPKCGVAPWHLEDFFSGSTVRWKGFQPINPERLRLVQQLPAFHKCPDCPWAEPAIAPPTWNKTEYHGILAGVWKGAAQKLFEADNIIVIGYSLPTNDLFFKYLFAIGTLGPSRLKMFRVYDPDNSGNVKERFTKLLGASTIDRFEFVPQTFSEAIKHLTAEDTIFKK